MRTCVKSSLATLISKWSYKFLEHLLEKTQFKTEDITAFKEASNQELTILPPTNNLLEKETSDKTDNLPFIETSPAEIILPVNEGAARGAFDAIKFVTVVENVASLPSAVANSFKVLRAPGAELIRALISPATKAVVAI